MDHVPKTLTSKMRRHTSTDAAWRSWCGIKAVVPALFTSVSRRPHRSSGGGHESLRHAALGDVALHVVRVGKRSRRRPPLRTRNGRSSPAPTRPASAKARAVAAPIPLDEPVTTTTWPWWRRLISGRSPRDDAPAGRPLLVRLEVDHVFTGAQRVGRARHRLDGNGAPSALDLGERVARCRPSGTGSPRRPRARRRWRRLGASRLAQARPSASRSRLVYAVSSTAGPTNRAS